MGVQGWTAWTRAIGPLEALRITPLPPVTSNFASFPNRRASAASAPPFLPADSSLGPRGPRSEWEMRCVWPSPLGVPLSRGYSSLGSSALVYAAPSPLPQLCPRPKRSLKGFWMVAIEGGENGWIWAIDGGGVGQRKEVYKMRSAPPDSGLHFCTPFILNPSPFPHHPSSVRYPVSRNSGAGEKKVEFEHRA